MDAPPVDPDPPVDAPPVDGPVDDGELAPKSLPRIPARDDEPGEDEIPDRMPGRPAGWAGGARDQILHQIFHWGLGDLDIGDIRIGDTPLADLQDVETEWGDADGAISLVAGNVDTEAGAALDDASWHERVAAAGATRLALDFVGRVFSVDDEGKPARHAIEVALRFEPPAGLDDPPAAVESTLDVAHASTEPCRVSIVYDLPAPGRWRVRVRRRTAPSEDDRVIDDLAWTALRSYQPDDAGYRGQTRLGVRIRASGQLSGRIDRLSGLVRQKVPVWDRGAWTPPRPSSNPAWIFRWYALGVAPPPLRDPDPQNPIDPLRLARLPLRNSDPDASSRPVVAGVGLDPARLDEDAIVRWGLWCDAQTPRLECNHVLSRDASHADVLALVARCGRASPTWATGRLGVVWEDADAPPTAMFTPGNIVADTMAVDWAPPSLAGEIAVRYVEPDLDWQWNTVRRTVPRRPLGQTATMTLPGVTSGEQAAAEANLQAARHLYHRERFSWRTGPEGLSVDRGDVVLLAHSLVAGGATGRLAAIAAGGGEARLDAPEVLPAGGHLVVRRPDGSVSTHAAAVPAGVDPADEQDRVALDPALAPDDLEPRDYLYHLYPADGGPIPVRVVSVEPTADGEATLQAIREAPEYHAAAASDLSAPLPALTRRPPKILDVRITEKLYAAGGGWALELQASLTVAGDWRGGDVEAAVDDAPARVVARLRDGETEAAWPAPLSGTATVRATPGSAAAPAGDVWQGEHAIQGLLAPPAAPAGFALRAAPGGYVASWTRPPEPDYARTEIREAPAAAPDRKALVASLAGTTWTRVLPGDYDAARRVWVSHVDVAGARGPEAALDVTALAPPEGLQIEEIFALFAGAAISTGRLVLPTTAEPDDAWPYDRPGAAGGYTWRDDRPLPTPAAPVRVRAVRRIPGRPAPGAARASDWSDWTWDVDQILHAATREIDVWRVVPEASVPAAGGRPPAAPRADRYLFPSDSLLGLDEGWRRRRPGAVGPRDLLYCSTATAVDAGTGNDYRLVFSAPVVCKDVVDLDVIYRRSGADSLPAPAPTAARAVAAGWHPSASAIPAAQTGRTWQCVRRLVRFEEHNLRWEHDDPAPLTGRDGLSARELTIYRTAPVGQPRMPAAPTAATWDHGADRLGGLGPWSRTWPDYDPATQQVVCAATVAYSDDTLLWSRAGGTARAWSPVRVCESPGDVNVVYRREPAGTTPERPRVGPRRVPAGWHDLAGFVAGAGLAWQSTGLRAARKGTWAWSEPVRIEAADGTSQTVRVYQAKPGRIVPDPPATPTGARFSNPLAAQTDLGAWSVERPRFDPFAQTCWYSDAVYPGAGAPVPDAAWTAPQSLYVGALANTLFARAAKRPRQPRRHDAGGPA